MTNHLTPSAKLNALILEAELSRRAQEEELKDEWLAMRARLRPSQLIKKAFSELLHAPDFKKDALSATLGLAAGFVSRKVVVRKSSGFLMKILGTLLQVGVSKLVGKKMNAISHPEESKALSIPWKEVEGTEESF